MNIIRLNSIGEPFAKSGQATPPSGGGTEGGRMYLQCDNVDNKSDLNMAFVYVQLLLPVSSIKIICEQGSGVYNNAAANELVNAGEAISTTTQLAFAVELNMSYMSVDNTMRQIKTKADADTLLSSLGLTMNFTEITKEQFYTL